jgi:hypothetical protein
MNNQNQLAYPRMLLAARKQAGIIPPVFGRAKYCHDNLQFSALLRFFT